LYINNGAGGFTALTGDTIVNDNKPSDGAPWADIDNDGDLDCYVANWYNFNNLIYTNNGSGTFTQMNGPVVISGGYCETASWGDYDNDGLVDLYVTNSAGLNKNLLYHNDSSNAFTKITTSDMVNDIFDSRCVNWTDMDSDGDLDLFVTNENNQNENIYRNDGSAVFTKLTAGALVNDGGKTMSAAWADYDNDGDMDVFLANDQGNDGLFRNHGNFNFTKITSDTVSNCGGNSFSSAWSDIDNDGDVDLFVTNSFWATTLLENFLFINNGNGTFSRVSNTTPATDLDWSYGCAFGDYDNDGFEDLAVATCRFNNLDRPDLLYHNDGNSNHWITIKLVGTITNKAAIGAKIRTKALINGIPIWQMREISAQSSYCGQNDIRAHFGLGNAGVVDSIKVEWQSGTTEFYINVSTDQFITITEGQGISGLVENNPDEDIQVFPNPTTGIIIIKSEKNKLQPGDGIVITNNLGEMEKEFLINTETAKFEINLKSLKVQSGVHYVSVFHKKDRLVHKVIKL